MGSQVDKKAMWDTIEANYWTSIKAARDREDQKLHHELQNQQSDIKRSLAENYARRTQLTLELTTVKSTIETLEKRLDSLSDEFNVQKAKMEHDRAHDDECQRTFFAKHRSGESAQGQTERILSEKKQTETNARQKVNAESHSANNGIPIRNGVILSNGQGPDLSGEPTGVHVVDAEGHPVGEVRGLGPHHNNRWINGLIQLPVKQDAVLRPGRKFTEEQFQSIHEPTDAKGAKWVGVMIQAKGEVQERPCQYCNKHTGVFRDCVLIGGEDFPRCGNCEWSRQACHFLLGNPPPMTVGPKPEAVHSAAVAVAAAAAAISPRPEYQIVASLPTNQPLPSTEEPFNLSRSNPSGFTAFNISGVLAPGSQGSPSQLDTSPTMIPTGTSTPIVSAGVNGESQFRQFVSNLPTKRPASEDGEEVSLPEITQANLTLRDNGDFYIEPACMADVPVRRVRPGDAYWEPEWQDVAETIGPQLNKWHEKLEQIKQNQNTTNAYRFQANRQVNRGNSILRYFEQAEFSPYQLVSKKLITSGIVTYDTLFRLVATLDELKKFSTVDVTPLQWVRQRLCEIYEEDPENFNLCKTVHDFYHDKKLVQLRKRNGFGNIGRPSGHRVQREREAASSANTSPAPRPSKRLRKPTVNPTSNGANRGSLGPDTAQSDRSASPAVGRAPKRQSSGTNPTPAIPMAAEPPANMGRDEHDLMFDGYTSTDSYSGDRVRKGDWRLYQIKTKDYTSNEHITQYWHWVDGVFEHQVLRDVEPTTSWGLYEDPINFHVKLAEIDDICYAPKSLKIIIAFKSEPSQADGSDVLVHFKRDRTMRRFLHFCHKKGIRLVKTTNLFVDNAWESTHIESEYLPGAEETSDGDAR